MKVFIPGIPRQTCAHACLCYVFARILSRGQMSDNEENDLFADDDDQERPPMLPALSPLRGGEDPHVGLVGAADQAKENEDLPKPRTRRPVPLLNDDRQAGVAISSHVEAYDIY